MAHLLLLKKLEGEGKMRFKGLKTVFLGVLIVSQITSNLSEVKDSELEEVYGGYLRADLQTPLQTTTEKIILWDEKRDLQKKNFENY